MTFSKYNFYLLILVLSSGMLKGEPELPSWDEHVTTPARNVEPQTNINPHTNPNVDTTQPIEPPFGLNWGESPENVWKWVKTNKFDTAAGKIKDGRNVIEILGPFPNAEFNRLRFYFLDNALTEVELQFIKTGHEEAGVEFDGITQAMAIKHKVDGRMGKGLLVKNTEGTDNGSKWKFIQQIWTDEEHSIWLAVFSSTSPKKEILSIVSLHYRWETKLNPLQPSPDAKKE